LSTSLHSGGVIVYLTIGLNGNQRVTMK